MISSSGEIRGSRESKSLGVELIRSKKSEPRRSDLEV